MLLEQSKPAKRGFDPLPRAHGSLSLTAKARDKRTCIDVFRAAGSLRAIFPRRADALEAVLVNTAGGLTGGDRFELYARARSGARLVLTTQAAERAYFSNSGPARVDSRLRIDTDARLFWLPQELIAFEGADISRRLSVDMGDNAEFLMVEPIIFGRRAMGEVLRQCTIQDRVRICRDGCPVYLDQIRLSGDLAAQLAQSATAGGSTAVATVVYVGATAGSLLPKARASLPKTGGASLVANDVLAIRLVAEDGYVLRSALCPLLETLSGTALPKCWRL